MSDAIVKFYQTLIDLQIDDADQPDVKILMRVSDVRSIIRAKNIAEAQLANVTAERDELAKALERIAHASDIYGVEANAEDQGAGTLAYAHKSTCNLARAALAALKTEEPTQKETR